MVLVSLSRSKGRARPKNDEMNAREWTIHCKKAAVGRVMMRTKKRLGTDHETVR